MIRNVTTYSAVTAKCRAMYGKRLTNQQWERLLSSKNLRSLWSILGESPAWRTVAETPRGAEDIGAFLGSLVEQLRADCHNLAFYVPKEDREMLAFFRAHLAEGMDPREYQQWWNDIGRQKRELRRLVGAEADALNLVYVLRLRRFPASIDRASEMLIPVHDQLRPDFIQKLLHAPSDAEVLALLARSPWKKEFTSLSPGLLEAQYGAYMRALCDRMLSSASPGPQEIQAFLTLKDMDRKRIGDIATAVVNGINPNRVV